MMTKINKLNLEVEKSGLSREAYLRSLIKHELPEENQPKIIWKSFIS